MGTLKTNEEIKKGLECCAASYADCHKECPYKLDCDGLQILKDNLALIQQLEAQNAKLQAERDAAVRDMYAECACDVCKYNDRTETICPRGIEVDNCFEWRGVQKEEKES